MAIQLILFLEIAAVNHGDIKLSLAKLFWRSALVDLTQTTNAVGWRWGQYTVGNTNYSNAPNNTCWSCVVTDVAETNGSIGFQVGGPEAYSITCRDCSFAQVAQGVLNGAIASTLSTSITPTTMPLPINAVPVPGIVFFPPCSVTNPGIVQLSTGEQVKYVGVSSTQIGTIGCTRGAGGTTQQSASAGVTVSYYVPNQGVYSGAGGFRWYDGTASNCAAYFWNQADSEFTVEGGRYETSGGGNGQRFFRFGLGSSTFNPSIHLRQFELAGFTVPTDNNGVFYIVSGNPNVCIYGMRAYENASSFGSTFIVNASAFNLGSLTVEKSAIYGTSSFYSNAVGWSVHLRDVQLTDSSFSPTSTLNQEYVPPVVLTDAPMVTLDLTRGSKFYLLTQAQISAPGAPGVSQTPGGSLGSRTEYFKITHVNPFGETTASSETSFGVSANNLSQVASPSNPGGNAIGYNVYGSTTSGLETLQNATSPIAYGTPWTELSSGLTNTGASPPVSNTTSSASRTLALTHAALGTPRFTLAIQQAASGGPYNATFFSAKWLGAAGAPTLSMGANAIDIIDFDQFTNGVYCGTPRLNYG